MNHYVIYELLDKFVRFAISKQKKLVEGVVTEVYRDPIKHQIEITLGTERQYVFPEPDAIMHDENLVIFIYGKQTDESDDAFFSELRRIGSQGLGADEAFKALESPSTAIKFIIGDIPKIYAKRRIRKRKHKKVRKRLVKNTFASVKIDRGKQKLKRKE